MFSVFTNALFRFTLSLTLWLLPILAYWFNVFEAAVNLLDFGLRHYEALGRWLPNLRGLF